MLGLDAKVVRNGSASCDVSPLSDSGVMSTTRTPEGGGGAGGEDAPPSRGFCGRRQAATTKATAARKVVTRMVTGYTGGSPRVRRRARDPGQRATEPPFLTAAGGFMRARVAIGFLVGLPAAALAQDSPKF